MQPDFSEGEILIVESVEVTLEDFLDRLVISPDLRQQLSRANLIILPLDVELPAPLSGPVFSPITDDLYQYLRDHAPPELIPEVAVADEDYRELDLRGDLEVLGGMVLLQGVLPFAIGLLTNFVSSRFDKRGSEIELELTAINGDGTGRRLYYKGPAAEFEQRVVPALRGQPSNNPTLNIPEGDTGIAPTERP